MHWRIFCVLLILTAGISLRSAQPALADYYCPPNLNYSFPDPWYFISASKYKPDQPVVKQQLEELAARGDLPNPPSSYDAEFLINVSIKSGLATYDLDEPYYVKEWVCNPYKVCKWEEVEHHKCVTQSPVPVYRSIQEVAFSLIPDGKTADWYGKLTQSPTVTMLYPNYWEPVVLGENGEPVGNFRGDLGGIHFFYSDPLLIGKYFYPSKLPQLDKAQVVFNPLDAGKIDSQVVKVIPVCLMYNGTVIDYGYKNSDMFVDSDIDADPYTCGKNIGYDYTGTKIQSIQLDVTNYDFDFPATFYLGVATVIAPALSPQIAPGLPPLDGKTEETDITGTDLEPSNYTEYLFKNTGFSVWMLASTPCQTADGGCDMLQPPGP